MQSSYWKRVGAVIIGVAIIVGTFEGGVRYGTQTTLALDKSVPDVYNKDLGKPSNVDFSLFWKAWQILNEKYVPTHSTSTTPVSDQDKMYGAIQGLADSFGDPYTVFFPPQDNKDFQSEISGNFEGIGMEVGLKDGVLTVISPLKDSPAEKAGIKAGDKVLKIDSTVTSSITIDQAINLIRGKKGTVVTLTILSATDKAPREIKVTRAQIDIPTIKTEKLPNGIFVIRLYSFTANSATLFRNSLKEFIDSGDNRLLLDLRGNPGGYLDAAVDMASWFLPSDKLVVSEDSAGHGQDEKYYSKGYNVFNSSNNKNFKMAILVDSGSASASEILAGALQQNGVAKLVGATTYGKGSVQELVPLTPDTSLKVTVARWLTPNGTSISAQGLTPDYPVAVSQDDLQNNKDTQMDKAVEVLSQ